MKKIIVLLALSIFQGSVLPGQNETNQKIFKASLGKLTEALQTHDFSKIESLLDEDFTLGSSACGGYCNSNVQAMKMIITSYPYQVKEITLDAVKPEATDFKLSTTFVFEKEKNEQQEILVSPEGKFLSMSIPRIRLRYMTTDSTTEKADAQKPCCKKKSSE